MTKYKKMILSIAQSRFKTIMIGSIARIEDYFGYLWGHNQEELTDRQKEFKALWEELRTEILNHGNFHIRKGLDEIEELLTVDDNMYEYKFIMNNRRKDNG